MFTNYRYIKVGNKMIALSTYAGKTVRGVAICSDHDTFDEAKGKELAAARCNEKVAEKRWKRASQKYAEAQEILREAHAYAKEMSEYYYNSFTAYNEAAIAVDKLMEKM